MSWLFDPVIHIIIFDLRPAIIVYMQGAINIYYVLLKLKMKAGILFAIEISTLIFDPVIWLPKVILYCIYICLSISVKSDRIKLYCFKCPAFDIQFRYIWPWTYCAAQEIFYFLYCETTSSVFWENKTWIITFE